MEVEVEEAGAQGLDLLLDRRPRIERAHDRSQPAGGHDGGQPGHTGPDDEHLGRRDRAGRSHEERKEAAECVGRLEDRLVAGQVRHRGERVHLLGARDARDRLHRQDGRARALERDDRGGVRFRIQERDERRSAPELRGLFRCRGLDLEHHVRRPCRFAAADLGPRRRVGGVVVARAAAGAGLHHDRGALLDVLARDVGRGRDPGLVRSCLPGDADPHTVRVLGAVVRRGKNGSPVYRRDVYSARSCPPSIAI